VAAADDPRDRLVGLIKHTEDLIFIPVFSLLLLSPLWGFALWWLLDWPLWLGILVAVVPSGSLFASGAMHVFLRERTTLRRSTASSFEPLLVTVALLLGVALPVALYYR
jgi:hypothetical protein